MQLSKTAKHRKNKCQQKPATGRSFVLCHYTVHKTQFLWLCLSSLDFFQWYSFFEIVNTCTKKEHKFVPQYFVVTCFPVICLLIKTSMEPSQANDKVRRALHQFFGGCEFMASSTGILECQVSFNRWQQRKGAKVRKDEKSANFPSRETLRFILRFQCKLFSFHSSKHKVEFLKNNF